jgi:hypothetical protein
MGRQQRDREIGGRTARTLVWQRLFESDRNPHLDYQSAAIPD